MVSVVLDFVSVPLNPTPAHQSVRPVTANIADSTVAIRNDPSRGLRCSAGMRKERSFTEFLATGQIDELLRFVAGSRYGTIASAQNAGDVASTIHPECAPCCPWWRFWQGSYAQVISFGDCFQVE